ncbi:hypothetical protein IGI04_014448 [Brassica rapa subsp. trilocularis]|uniref:Uncharacterized protein n=1 Tax=Brassica rapa subsp. trilocularis TaxID=1813537 RepID=A0ABQ7MM79_BRACM|nr:hypothetical protein IGI04_014448 [Brassica rapa subsp. trilocularis]
MKTLVPFSSHRLRQQISIVYPAMTFLSPPSSSMIKSRSEENLSKLNDCMENMDDDVSEMFMECHQTDFRSSPQRLLHHEQVRQRALRVSEEVSGESTTRGVLRVRRGVAGCNSDDDGECDVFSGKLQVCHRDLAEMIVKLESTMKEVERKLRRVRGKRAVVTAAIIAPAVERSIRVTADFAVKKRSSVAVAMGEMERERKRLKSTLVDLDRETGRCGGFVEFGRRLAKGKIFEFLSCGEKSSNS